MVMIDDVKTIYIYYFFIYLLFIYFIHTNVTHRGYIVYKNKIFIITVPPAYCIFCLVAANPAFHSSIANMPQKFNGIPYALCPCGKGVCHSSIDLVLADTSLRSRPQKGFKRMKLQRRLMKSFQWTSSRRLKESIATIESNMYYDYTEYYVGPAIMTGDQMKVNNRPQRAHFGLCYGGKLPVYSSGFWVEHHMRHMRTFCFCFVFLK